MISQTMVKTYVRPVPAKRDLSSSVYQGVIGASYRKTLRALLLQIESSLCGKVSK
jgi:hypothetical protein